MVQPGDPETEALESEDGEAPSYLVVLTGPDRGTKLRLRRGTYHIGTSPECDLVLADRAVSRRHFSITVGGDGVFVRDLGSKNGSFFGGARFSEITVSAGAIVRVGETQVQLVGRVDSDALPPSQADTFGRLIGRSLGMRRVFSLCERVAASDVSVLVEGETGTGKELCAEAIHGASARAGGPFVICDLAGVSRNLVESELFGHVRGAFTGADRDRDGAFVRAHKGTLFIDEIGELDLEAQPRLLRALEERQVKPVGADEYEDVDVRVVAATNRDLAEECKAGRFREDLYHRLAVVHLPLPPLRARKEDIELLIQHFLADAGGATLSAEARALLVEYDWPGNVRELRNTIERGRSLLGSGTVITPALLGLTAEPGAPPPPAQVLDGAIPDFHSAKERLIAGWERAYLSELLRKAGGNISRAARSGGLDRPYLYRLLKKHGLGADGEAG